MYTRKRDAEECLIHRLGESCVTRRQEMEWYSHEPRDAGSRQGLEGILLLEPLGGGFGPADTLIQPGISDLWDPEQWDNKFTYFKTQNLC